MSKVKARFCNESSLNQTGKFGNVNSSSEGDASSSDGLDAIE